MTDMTNAALNRAIAELHRSHIKWRSDHKTDAAYVNYQGTNTVCTMVNYTNNWSDLMPLIIEHDISLLHGAGTKEWRASTQSRWRVTEEESWHVLYSTNKSPQIALATCLLEVLRAKNKEQE